VHALSTGLHSCALLTDRAALCVCCRYKSELRDAPDGNPTPWKAFFLKWVVPEIEKQYVAKEQPAGGSSLVLPRIKKYDLVKAPRTSPRHPCLDDVADDVADDAYDVA
jgi:hypothetical protein